MRLPTPLVPVLVEDRLVARAATRADAPAFAEAVRESLRKMRPWLPWAVDDFDDELAIARIERERDDLDSAVLLWIVTFDSVLVGECTIRLRTDEYGEIGYWTRTSLAGQGIATSATRLVTTYGFEKLRLARIFIRADPDNLASQRVALKAGFRRQEPPLLPPWRHEHRDGSAHSLLEYVRECGEYGRKQQ